VLNMRAASSSRHLFEEGHKDINVKKLNILVQQHVDSIRLRRGKMSWLILFCIFDRYLFYFRRFVS